MALSVPRPADSALPPSSSSTKPSHRPSLLSFHSSRSCPTGLAPSSPSLHSSEARASHVPYTEPPLPSTCPISAPAPRDSLPLSSSCNHGTPFSSSSSPVSSPSPSSSSQPVSRGKQRSRPLHRHHHSLPNPTTRSPTTTSHQALIDPKPFAKQRPSTAASPCDILPSPPTEDLDDFERRLTESLSAEFAQLAVFHESTLLDKMNLARSFTKRLARPTSPEVNNDTNTAKTSRPQISNPMGLISTTNQWVHEVPNISDLHVKDVQQRQISSSSSDSSASGSDSETSPSSEPPSMTDSSSVESFSPVEPNHLTPYFTPSSDVTPSKIPSSTLPIPNTSSQPEPRLIAAPAIPRRAPSHSKREHERLAHARSIRSSTELTVGTSSQHNSLSSDASQSVNASAIKDVPSLIEEDSESSSPFSNELKQLDEVAEEFGSVLYTVYTKEDDEDRRIMSRLGLKQYRVSEYLRDIASFRQGLWDLIEEEEEDEDEFDEAAESTPWI